MKSQLQAEVFIIPLVAFPSVLVITPLTHGECRPVVDTALWEQLGLGPNPAGRTTRVRKGYPAEFSANDEIRDGDPACGLWPAIQSWM